MPKKHVPSYAHTKPSYVHPSLQSSRSPSSPSEPQSVNQRIQQLRREQTPRATSERRRDEVIEVVTSRTVPPDLRRILRMAEVDAPRPEPGTRTRSLRAAGGARPPPGPATPSSWLHTSRHAPSHVRNLKRKYIGTGQGPSRVCALARATDDEFKRFPSSRSLVHHCLRVFALRWQELAEYEQHYIPALSTPLKEVLLSYISLYGDSECMDFTSFKILFQNDEGSTLSESDEVKFLDLTGLLNNRFTLGDLGKCLPRLVHGTSVTDGIAQLSLTSPEKSKGKEAVEVADSWEDELDDPTSPPAAVLPATLTIPIFPNLTRLSLAHPRSYASWADLLALAPKLNTLTHLSLAHWPRPSTTPNAATTSMISNHTSVSLGGSHFYSDLDDDWHEAANILRRLSLHTYCLQWLDLEGCNWHKALTYDMPTPANTNNPNPTAVTGITPPPPLSASSTRSSKPESWTTPQHTLGPDFNGAWRQITYLNLFQGWVPSDTGSLQNMPAGVLPAQLLRWLRENKGKKDVGWKLGKGETFSAVAGWVEREKIARGVRMKVQGMRKWAEGRWCVIDHGWGD